MMGAGLFNPAPLFCSAARLFRPANVASARIELSEIGSDFRADALRIGEAADFG
ncbi:hypothetical protein EKH55_3084 [Sinorhizobium alkalisoli]|nr:hypothetical protein EKH55_3084 [Sinorhizobium alkalisoli]